MRRRALLGIGAGTVAVAGTGFGIQLAVAESSQKAASTPEEAAEAIKKSFETETEEVGGWWNGYISVTDADGEETLAVDAGSDDELEAWSCNKVPVAVAMLEKVDKGDLSLDQLIEVPEDIVSDDGDGIFWLDRAYPSQVTLGHVLANMLSVSDNTAVRLCGTLVPGEEINEILADKGFPKTQVEPLPDNPNRFYLGKTTPKETHELWKQLVAGELLSAESSDHILAITRSMAAFTDGIRRNMSSDERLQIATKAGWLKDQRNEVGVIFNTAGAPVCTFTVFGGDQGDEDNFGATHPATQAIAKMGRTFLDVVSELDGNSKATTDVPEYNPVNGG